MTPRHDPFDRLRSQLGEAAVRQSVIASSFARPPRRWWTSMRPLGIVLVGVLATGSAAAGVLISTTSTSQLSAAARPDAPAAQNLTSLNHVLDALPREIREGEVSPHSTSAGRSVPPAQVLGTTVSRGAVSVDVTLTTSRVCLAPGSTADHRDEIGCALLPLATDRLAFVQGRESDQAWVAAAVPDGVRDVEVTADTGAVDTATIESNVAIAIVQGAHTIRTLSWQGSDGSRHSQSVGNGPDNATQAAARPLDR